MTRIDGSAHGTSGTPPTTTHGHASSDDETAVALLAGIGLRITAVAGGILYVMMWTVVLPPENNPFLDDHLINAAVLAGLALLGAGRIWGLGKAWEKLPIVRRQPWLK